MFLAETVETGDKNRDDFHVTQMQRVMSMWFIFRDNWSYLPSWTCFGFLAMMKFSPNQGPWFSCLHIRVLKSKYSGEYLTKIQFRGVLRRYLSQNIDTITGILWWNRFDIADSTVTWDQAQFEGFSYILLTATAEIGPDPNSFTFVLVRARFWP